MLSLPSPLPPKNTFPSKKKKINEKEKRKEKKGKRRTFFFCKKKTIRKTKEKNIKQIH